MSNGKLTNWNDITTEEAYRLSQAEFKGMVMESLQDIRRDIHDLQGYNNNTRYISMFIAGIAGIMSGIFGGQVK